MNTNEFNRSDRVAVTLDFTSCREVGALYDQMREKMCWQDWYGENLDALWDILTGLPYVGDDFLILRPGVYPDLPAFEGEYLASKVDGICAVFQDAQEEYGRISVAVQYV